MIHATQYLPSEWSYTSVHAYSDPFDEVELDLLVTGPQGEQYTVPAFWSGEQTWRVRFAPPQPGRYTFRSACSDAANPSLHGLTGELIAAPYRGNNPLLCHGPLRQAADRRHLEHADGTPFFWLADTWWMALVSRLRWPEDLQELVADRVAKGFTVIQLVAGLFPDMPPFDPRGANEAGQAWEPGFARINPAWFDLADLRIAHLVRAGLAPCIVGSWGYYLGFAGADVLKKHWRYLIARYACYPVIWCTAGEACMHWYLQPAAERKSEAELRAAWSDLVRTIRRLDPYQRPVTIHPTQHGHDQLDDPSLLDLDMLQTGHSGYVSLAPTVDSLLEALEHEPRLPVLVGEVNYEGIMEGSREEVQRFHFWSCLLSGAAGHTYGANGIWQVNAPRQPYGPSPHGTSWGDTPWTEAYRLPGSRQLGLGKRLLERYAWQQLEPHPEWVEPHQAPGERISAYCAGIPERLRVIYFPASVSWVAWNGRMVLKALEPGVEYHAFYFDPKTGNEYDLGTVRGDAEGEWRVPKPPIFQDWVLVLERSA